ncbi:MAG: phage GP46 family protein [Deltaproteobacteria bacterium]|nr:phage GP46 family protein [Deltaproteobacteria bacterium]
MKQAPPESTQDEQGGYWADLTDRKSMGSYLWLFSREVPGDETMFRIRQEALSALEWLISAGMGRLPTLLSVPCRISRKSGAADGVSGPGEEADSER